MVLTEDTAGTPLSAAAELMQYGRSIARDLILSWARPRVRTDARVHADYEAGEWAAELQARRWERAPTLRDYVCPNDSRIIVALVDGRLRRLSVGAYYRYRTERLQSIMVRFAGDRNRLIELGCGAGRNLFALSLDGRWQLRGYDISPTGLAVVEEVRASFGVPNLEVEPLDLLGPSHAFPDLSGETVFTWLCLEQLPGRAEQVLRALIEVGVARGIHVEPSLESFSPFVPRDLATIIYLRRQDYQRSLTTTLKGLEAEGRLRLVHVERANLSPKPGNEPMLLVWDRVDR
ncbi:hypothetical protein [Thermaurantiacus sp.]